MDVYPPVDISTDFLGYRIEELIGLGGMGVVYKAHDLRLKRPVALKLVTPSLARDERFRERFAREAELVMSLEHPNVVPIYDAGEVDGRVYLAMRLVDGTDLGSVLRGEGALEPARAVAICRQVASALDAAHARGLVHRDVKPSNVLLDSDEHVYLADFGLTRRFDDETGDPVGDRSIGTPAYLAPEQLDGQSVDGRADVYSLGCLLYECLTGERVFPGDSRLAVAWAHLEEEPPRASERRPDLPDPIDAVIFRALAKVPEQRYASCGALLAAAEGALGLLRPPRFGRRSTVAVAALVLAIVASLVVALATRGGPATPPRAHDNTLVRIDPGTGRLQKVMDVGRQPMAVSAWSRTVWVYSNAAGVVSEIDAQTNRVLHTTPILATPIDLRTVAGPVLAADANGAWIVGVESRGRSRLTLVPRGGGRRAYPLDGLPEAVATDLGVVWVLTRGARHDRLFRLDPATGAMTAAATFPASDRVDSLAVGFGDVWVVSSSTATLYRVDPRLTAVDHVDLGRSAGRPAALFGAIWISLADNGGDTLVVNPRTLATQDLGSPQSSTVAGVSAFGSVWDYDAAKGTVERWNPSTYQLDHLTEVTDPPFYDGSCLTSIAAGTDAVWVTLAPAVEDGCGA